MTDYRIQGVHIVRDRWESGRSKQVDPYIEMAIVVGKSPRLAGVRLTLAEAAELSRQLASVVAVSLKDLNEAPR